MNFLRAWFINFLAVFFVNGVIPGIQINLFDQVPNLFADILFSLLLSALNASVFFFLIFLEIPVSHFRLALITGILSFGGFLTIVLFPLGIQVVSFAGFALGGSLVWLAAYLTNYFEWRYHANP